ncbi:PQQ-dependent sugar dehydrogenase [Aquimarina sp. ERC-38]|uniref:PQQ-dependent sugar dehydrogenase n=1 Tax=Aquimarina sp. ERC-38 TaxID=2949996 RepID=UPI002245D0F3|nr:PQQ-dependent sugar dehydrogenase [Aquimarina sp. ERC-38]UZO79352.1 PQQ-dependent sugar dehydrogenase [Aquimarina sp. ERC-38]
MKTCIYIILLCLSPFIYAQDIDIELVADGFSFPVFVTNAGDERLFVVEQEGAIKIIEENGTVAIADFLNIQDRVFFIRRGGEPGLLGLAFHPEYATNGFFYVNYTHSANNQISTRISRFSRNTNNPNLADPNSELILLEFNQPFSNHNGGDITFGTDGLLYIASGDGGSGGDPMENSQNINNLLGKILRIDVDAPAPYIPSDNPFVNKAGADEIWAYGLRNPWRFSFDSQTNDLWIADVGQNAFEEINKTPGNIAGQNFGWDCREGGEKFNPTRDDTACPSDLTTLIDPIATYNHVGSAKSVTGGYVYRGTQYPSLQGLYIFGDYLTNEIGTIDSNNTNDGITWVNSSITRGISSFGIDSKNELYIIDYGGVVYRVIDENTLGSENPDIVDFSIYPNPATDQIRITYEKNIKNIIIFDVQGKQVKKVNFKNKKANEFIIDNLNSGVYFVQLTDYEQNKLSKKIVIE